MMAVLVIVLKKQSIVTVTTTSRSFTLINLWSGWCSSSGKKFSFQCSIIRHRGGRGSPVWDWDSVDIDFLDQ